MIIYKTESLHISLNVIIRPRIEYIYANIIDTSIFIIFYMTYVNMNMSLIDTHVHAVYYLTP